MDDHAADGALHPRAELQQPLRQGSDLRPHTPSPPPAAHLLQEDVGGCGQQHAWRSAPLCRAISAISVRRWGRTWRTRGHSSLPAVERDRRDAEDLAQARVELENIASAIRLGIVTPTTKAMLEDAERRITPFEAGLHAHGPPRFR